jgi:hypothetical protein
VLFALSASADTRFVDPGCSNPTPPYTNWVTAAITIQDAIDVAAEGETILVTNGVFRTGGRVVYGLLTNRIVINKAVTVRSVNGSSVTAIEGNPTLNDNAVRCAYLTNNAALVGFTLTSGRTRGTSLPPPDAREEDGGGAWCESTNALLLDCLVVSNAAWSLGGGVYAGTCSNCVLQFNSAYIGSGGGAAWSALDHCVLKANQAYGSGGAAIRSLLNRCSVMENSVVGIGPYGGGVSACIVNDSSLTGNTTPPNSGYGGGAYAGELNRCTISSNYSFAGGGAFSSALNNCIVAGNTASGSGDSGGGGVFGGVASNCTVVANACTIGSGGGVNRAVLYNSIVYSNSCTRYWWLADSAGYSALTNCCTPLNFGGANITNAPIFVDLAGGNFRLQSNSPCINAGNNAYASGATDLDGNPRIQGGTVDIGAYEFQTPSSIISYAWLLQYGLPTDGSADYTDPDQDGMNTWQEWRCGTNPTDHLSVLAMLAPSNSLAGVMVSWQSVAGITYYLQRARSLSALNAFSAAQSNIVGQGKRI